MKKLKLGIIGSGGIAAKLHLPDLAKSNDFEVAVLGGRKEARLKLLCQQFRVPRWTRSYDDIIADPKLDAVIIATPHPQHVRWGIAAVQAGRHVLMQKPLCGEMKEANAFVRAVEKFDRTVLCMPHFGNATYTIRKLCADGVIGKVSGARCRTSHGGPEVYYREVSRIFGESETDDLWFFDSKRASVGALFDMGVYAVSHLVAILGTIRSVSAVVTTFDKPTELEDQATLILQTESGAIATAETSWCDPARTWELSVHGTRGKFTSPGKDGAELTQWTPLAYDSDHAPIRSEAVKCREGVGGLHAHFADCIRRGIQPPLENVWLARHITEVMLAGLEAGKKGENVELKTKASGP